MNVVNVISMGGEPHPCDLNIPFEQQDYIIRKTLAKPAKSH